MVDGSGLLLTGGSGVVADAVGVALAVEISVCVVGFAVVLEVLAGVGVELADDVAVAVVVLGLADVDAFADDDELVVAVAVCAECAGSAVGSLVDGCGLGELLGVAVGVGVAVGEEVDCANGWHCCTAPVDAATATVSSAGWAASEHPETAAARTPPVTTPTISGCTCAIRMKGPARAVRGLPCSCRTPQLDTNDSAQC